MPVPVVLSLSVHRTYRCAHAGACCTASWPIAVEEDTLDTWHRAIARGELRRPAPPASGGNEVPAPALPLVRRTGDDTAGGAVLAVRHDGACVFHESGSRRCAVHRQLDHAALPLACRQFPRVTLRDARGIRVSLSHYCPTAAQRLFDDDADLRIVDDAPAFPPTGEYEGLDARDALPPLLRPGVLHSWESLTAWERLMVDVLGRDDLDARAALDAIADAAERVRTWTAADGPLASVVEARRHATMSQPPDESAAPTARADAPGEETARALLAPWQRPIRRYLAARAFASWTPFMAGGIRTAVRALQSTLAMVERHVLDGAVGSGMPAGRSVVVDAIRGADLALLHVGLPDVFAQDLATREHVPLEGGASANSSADLGRRRVRPRQRGSHRGRDSLGRAL